MTRSSREQFIQRARATKAPVRSLALLDSVADLAPLDGIAGEARVVGIGESWHSARQLLAFRNRMVRYLIERRSFDVLIFEGSVSGAGRVDAFVKGEPSDPALVLRHLGQAMWLNRETADFLLWLREYNTARPPHQRVSICGMDSVPPTAALSAMPAYFARVDAVLAADDLAFIERIARRFEAVPLSSTSRAAIWGASEVFVELGPSDRGRLRSIFSTIVSRLKELQKTYAFASSKAEFRSIVRDALMVVQACDILGARLTSPREANHQRDLAFSENVAWVLDDRPGSKAIIFGHNIHMAKEPFRSFDSEELVTTLGERLAQWYGADYVAIGSAVGVGRLSGEGPGLVDIPAEDNRRRRSSLASIDAALEEVGEQQFLLAMPSDLEWTQTSQSMRSHLEPTSDYIPARAFDAIAFVDGIAAATPLPDPSV